MRPPLDQPCSSSLCISEGLQRDSAECRALGIAHKTRSADRCFQILCSRRLKLDGFSDIRYAYVPPVLESALSPEDVGFPQLGK
jgi:hypothetical protein